MTKRVMRPGPVLLGLDDLKMRGIDMKENEARPGIRSKQHRRNGPAGSASSKCIFHFPWIS